MYVGEISFGVGVRAWRLLASAASACLVLTGCGTTSLGSTVGTSVEADGGSLDFLWAAEHPWASTFQQSGSLRLYAQYRRGGEAVEENLGAGRLIGQRQIRFTLPRGLRGVPDGPVCLFLTGGRSGVAVPVRSGSTSAGDTAKFRYPAWDVFVRTNSVRANDEREIAELSSALVDADRRVAAEDTALAGMGVFSTEDCARLSVPVTTAESTPKDVIAPSQQAGAAQRICVRRTRNMRNPELIRAAYKVDVQEVMVQFRPDPANSEAVRRQAEARQFQAQWQRWIDKTGVEYSPEVGSANEFLPSVGTVLAAIAEWNAVRASYPGTPAPLVVVGGLLDAYKGCLEDVTKQLAIKHDAWQKARTNQPQRDRLYAERKVAECTSRVADHIQLKSRVAELHGQLDAMKQRLSNVPSGEPRGFGSGRRLLNGESCSL